MKAPKNILLVLVGLFLVLVSLAMNLFMIIGQVWPTILFVLIGVIGVGHLLLARVLKRLSLFGQLGWLLVPFLPFFVWLFLEAPSHDTILLPTGYRGDVSIEYSVAEGAPKEFEGRRRIYRIPPDGKLRTQFRIAGRGIDYLNTQFFFEDSTGQRISIPVKDYYSTENIAIVHIFNEQLYSTDVASFRTFSVGNPHE